MGHLRERFYYFYLVFIIFWCNFLCFFEGAPIDHYDLTGQENYTTSSAGPLPPCISPRLYLYACKGGSEGQASLIRGYPCLEYRRGDTLLDSFYLLFLLSLTPRDHHIPSIHHQSQLLLYNVHLTKFVHGDELTHKITHNPTC